MRDIDIEENEITEVKDTDIEQQLSIEENLTMQVEEFRADKVLLCLDLIYRFLLLVLSPLIAFIYFKQVESVSILVYVLCVFYYLIVAYSIDYFETMGEIINRLVVIDEKENKDKAINNTIKYLFWFIKTTIITLNVLTILSMIINPYVFAVMFMLAIISLIID